jgi:membrane-bound metal-dependent hydrolase YbcI (DUF457 family)
MPGTVVHLAFSGMLAAALLGAAFDRKAVAVVFAVTAFPDLDSFIALVSVAGHRTVLHNLVVPTVAMLVLWVDTSLRSRSVVRERWGAWGVRVAWVSLVAYVVSGVGLDFVGGSVNLLYPLHDQFYNLEGAIRLSDQRGFVQTFVELGDGDLLGGQGSSEQINISTGVDPDPSGKEETPERVFNVVRTGWGLLILVVGTLVTWARFRLSHALE